MVERLLAYRDAWLKAWGVLVVLDFIPATCIAESNMRIITTDLCFEAYRMLFNIERTKS